MSANGDETPPANAGEHMPPPVATLSNPPKRIKYKEQPFPEDASAESTTVEEQLETRPSENTAPKITITEPNMVEDPPETPLSTEHATPSPAQFPKLHAIPEKLEAQ